MIGFIFLSMIIRVFSSCGGPRAVHVKRFTMVKTSGIFLRFCTIRQTWKNTSLFSQIWLFPKKRIPKTVTANLFEVYQKII